MVEQNRQNSSEISVYLLEHNIHICCVSKDKYYKCVQTKVRTHIHRSIYS